MSSKPYNGGQWTEARMNQFVRSALRKAMWPPKYAAIRQAYVREGPNPATGRKCKLHRCAKCRDLFPQNGVQADHINPVIGPDGFQSWDVYIRRLFCEAEGFRVLCRECHRKVTGMERFKVDEVGFAKRDALRTFNDLSAREMSLFMESIGLDGSGRMKDMRKRYEHHLDEIAQCS